MSWSTAPTVPERKTGAAWTTTATVPGRARGAGWFSMLEYVVPFNGSGTLSTNIATNYPNRTANFSATGTLTAAVPVVKPAAAAFTASGSLTCIAYELQTASRTVNFSATGSNALTTVNEGLWAIIEPIGGTIWAEGLSATISGISGNEGLAASIYAIATGVTLAPFTATGDLTATASQKYAITAALGDA